MGGRSDPKLGSVAMKRREPSVARARASATSAAVTSFHPRDRSFNRANALYLAHASDVAYQRSPAKAVRERLGLEATAFRHKVTRTRGYLGVCDTHAVLAFRGSDPMTLPNWLTDMVVRLVECGEYEGRVHYGFSSALRSTWSMIETALSAAEERPLFITGHSMGGALAVLAACRLSRLGRPPAAIYTFGAPRVGDVNFCARYELPTYRVVNRLDIVPEVPLVSVDRLLSKNAASKNSKLTMRLKRMAERVPGYDHVNTLVYIDRDGVVTTGANIEPWHTHAVARAIATRGKSFLEGITDHLLGNYIRGLEGQVSHKQAGARRRRNAD